MSIESIVISSTDYESLLNDFSELMQYRIKDKEFVGDIVPKGRDIIMKAWAVRTDPLPKKKPTHSGNRSSWGESSQTLNGTYMPGDK